MDKYGAIVGAIENLKEALGKAGFHLEVGIGAKPGQQEKPGRKIDGWEFKDWRISSDDDSQASLHVYDSDGEWLASLKTKELAGCFGGFPDVMRTAIDMYNYFDEFEHNDEEEKRHFKLGRAIKKAGFGADIKKSDRFSARIIPDDEELEDFVEAGFGCDLGKPDPGEVESGDEDKDDEAEYKQPLASRIKEMLPIIMAAPDMLALLMRVRDYFAQFDGDIGRPLGSDISELLQAMNEVEKEKATDD